VTATFSLGRMWNYAVAGTFQLRRLHPSAPTKQSALEPGPPPREPGFPLREEWQLSQRQSERRTKISLQLKMVFSTEIKEISPWSRSSAS
jgi:hypothetical protein